MKGWFLMSLASLGCSSAALPPSEAPRIVAAESTRAIAVVRVHAPWYAPRFAIVGRFRDAVPEYEGVRNLENKYFTITDERLYGGIYVWQTRADADAYYGPEWRAGIRKRRGVDPDLVVLESPFGIEGTTRLEGTPIGERGLRSSSTAALVLWPARDPNAAGLLATSLTTRSGPNLVKAYVVTAGPNRVGFLGLWPTLRDASTATDDAHLAALSASFGAGAPDVTLFDTPVLIDAGVRHAGGR